MANNSNPSAMTAAACRIWAAEVEGAAVDLMTGIAVGPVHVMSSNATHQVSLDIIILFCDIVLGSCSAHLCNVLHSYFEMGCWDS